MRHLEHVRPQRHARGQHLCLRGDLDVAGQQHGSGRCRRTHHGRAVVDLGAVVRVDVLGYVLRTEHLQGQRGPHEPGTGLYRDHPRTDRCSLPREAFQCPPRFVDRPDGDDAHRPAAQRPGEAADVVRVQVTDQDHRQRRDTQPVEAGIHRSVARPGVDQHGPPLLPGREDQCVALADIARHHGPARRRPARPQHPGGHEHQ
jgi:hypothetical protein